MLTKTLETNEKSERFGLTLTRQDEGMLFLQDGDGISSNRVQIIQIIIKSKTYHCVNHRADFISVDAETMAVFQEYIDEFGYSKDEFVKKAIMEKISRDKIRGASVPLRQSALSAHPQRKAPFPFHAQALYRRQGHIRGLQQHLRFTGKLIIMVRKRIHTLRSRYITKERGN